MSSFKIPVSEASVTFLLEASEGSFEEHPAGCDGQSRSAGGTKTSAHPASCNGPEQANCPATCELEDHEKPRAPGGDRLPLTSESASLVKLSRGCLHTQWCPLGLLGCGGSSAQLEAMGEPRSSCSTRELGHYAGPELAHSGPGPILHGADKGCSHPRWGCVCSFPSWVALGLTRNWQPFVN